MYIGRSLAVFIKSPQAGANRRVESVYQLPQPAKATVPSTAQMTAEMMCHVRIGTRRVMRSPSQTTGALASIMPKVVPATTHNRYSG